MAHPNRHLLFPEPLLSTFSAHLISLLIATAYVSSIYLSQHTRLSLESWNINKNEDDEDEDEEARRKAVKGTRDDPDIIRARLLAVSIATVVCIIAVFAVIWSRMGWDTNNLDLAWNATVLRLGLPLFFDLPTSFSFHSLTSFQHPETLLSHLIVPILFSGPLFASFLGGQLPGQARWRWHTNVTERFFTIQGARNYFIGPITEELVFRGCVLTLWHLADAGRSKMVWFAPLTFGLAHVHHIYEVFHRYGRNLSAAKLALFNTVFQLAYTTVFGALVSFLFLRTGSILPPITAHMFCNVMGFPELNTELRRFPKWRRAIIVAYILGIVGFFYTLNRWTIVANNLYWPRGEDMFLMGRF